MLMFIVLDVALTGATLLTHGIRTTWWLCNTMYSTVKYVMRPRPPLTDRDFLILEMNTIKKRIAAIETELT